VLVRPGSILQPHWPAALGNRAHTLARVQSNVLALLALATGGDAAAPNSVYNIYFLRGFDMVRNEFFLCSDGVAVGYGARPFADGLDAIYYVAPEELPGRVHGDGVSAAPAPVRAPSGFRRAGASGVGRA
jgi:N-methylhydantoinase B